MAVSSGRSHHLPAASFTVSIGRALLACSSFPYLSTTSTAARPHLPAGPGHGSRHSTLIKHR
uniref:Uncharacterized protein n=1 Tax=Zea mays TaxID=4577 RepID=C4J5M0_MAIZE|nr:unknown [Zea mays]